MLNRAQILLFTALGCALTMHAQWNGAATYDLGMGMGPIALMTGNLSFGRMITEESLNAGATGSRTAQNAAELVFKPNSVVSANLRQKFEQIMLSRALPGKRGVVQQELEKLQPVLVFNTSLTKLGFSPHDMADVATGYMADSWQLMNDAPDPPRATLLALNRQLRGGLLKSHALAKLSNDQKQQIAELLAYEDFLNELATQAPDVRSDPSRRAQAQKSLADQFRQLVGLDLRRVDLTPSGLSVRQ